MQLGLKIHYADVRVYEEGDYGRVIFKTQADANLLDKCLEIGCPKLGFAVDVLRMGSAWHRQFLEDVTTKRQLTKSKRDTKLKKRVDAEKEKKVVRKWKKISKKKIIN